MDGHIMTYPRQIRFWLYTENLSQILSEYAMLAAFEDDRFEPIEHSEVADL